MIKNFLQSCDYENGYRKALEDVKAWFSSHSVALGHYRMYNRKGVEKILSELSAKWESFIEEGEDMEIIVRKEIKEKKLNGEN